MICCPLLEKSKGYAYLKICFVADTPEFPLRPLGPLKIGVTWDPLDFTSELRKVPISGTPCEKDFIRPYIFLKAVIAIDFKTSKSIELRL